MMTSQFKEMNLKLGSGDDPTKTNETNLLKIILSNVM